MPVVNLILNGTFEAGLTDWTATDGEVNPESAYFTGSSSSNRVSEFDGTGSPASILEQSFTIDNAVTRELTFDFAVRSAGIIGSDGFTVEILDSGGGVVETMTYFPTNNTGMLAAPPLEINFPSGGTYTLRITEVGPNDTLGALIDNIELLVCFAGDTLVRTKEGLIKASEIQLGQQVWTQENGYQSVKWVGKRAVSKIQQITDQRLRPVLFKQGSLGVDMPAQDLMVSQNHRMVLSNWKVQTHLGLDQALAPAKYLIDGENVTLAPYADVEFVHFMFEEHQIVDANGCLSESFYPGAQAIQGVEQEARDELFMLFPELESGCDTGWEIALPLLKRHESKLVFAS